MDAQCRISLFWGYPVVNVFLEMAKYFPPINQRWSSHGASNEFFLNLNKCAKNATYQISQLLGNPVVHFS